MTTTTKNPCRMETGQDEAVRKGAEKCSVTGQWLRVPGSVSCPCLAAALHKPGSGVKPAPLALTCVGCEKTGKVIDPVVAPSPAFPHQALAQPFVLHSPRRVSQGAAAAEPAAAVLLPPACACIMDAGRVSTVCSHHSGCCFLTAACQKTESPGLKGQGILYASFQPIISSKKKKRRKTPQQPTTNPLFL